MKKEKENRKKCCVLAGWATNRKINKKEGKDKVLGRNLETCSKLEKTGNRERKGKNQIFGYLSYLNPLRR